MTYTAGKRVTLQVTLGKSAKWTQCYGYRVTDITLYRMTDSEGQILVWKTSGVMALETEDADGTIHTYCPDEGDVVDIKATIKGDY